MTIEYTRTPNYALYKPTPGADDDQWGDHLNLNADILDATLGVGGISVLDWLPDGQPDGVTDLAAYFQDAIDAAANVGDGNRSDAPGSSRLMIPANANAYIIGTGLVVPSNSHIIIAAGATLKIADSSNANCFQMAPGVPANIIVELYGTLDGNAYNQPPGGPPFSGGIVGACNNIYVVGNRQGVITNFKNWPVSLGPCTNGEVRGVIMTNSGNSCEFAGVATKWAISGLAYNSANGVTTLTTSTTHSVVAGGVFTVSGIASGTGSYLSFQGEWTATAVTSTSITFTADAGLGSPTFTGGNVATTAKSYNVGFVDCTVGSIRDIDVALYGGCVGGYVRQCRFLDGGPAIFIDNAQPGVNYDCEISGCACTGGAGISVVSNTINLKNRHSRIFDNVVSGTPFNVSLGVGEAYDTEVYGNVLHDNAAGLDVLSGQASQLNISHSAIRADVWGNTIRDTVGLTPVTRTNVTIASTGNSYNPATGAVSLTTVVAHNLSPGSTFYLSNMFGNPLGYLGLNGWQTAIASTAGTTLNFTAASGLDLATITGGTVVVLTYALPSSAIASGSYDPATGIVTVTTSAPHGMVASPLPVPFVVSGAAGTGSVHLLNGFQTLTAVTSATVFTFTIGVGLTLTIVGGTILPANFGVSINAPNYCRIANNRIGDTQPTANMVAAIGGAWGSHGVSEGNYYAYCRATGGIFDYPSDATVASSSSAQGISYDTVTRTYYGTITNKNIGNEASFPAVGLTAAWNLSNGRGEVNLLCGEGGGTSGGFNVTQVTSEGVINSAIGVGGSLLANDGYGNTRLGGALVHGSMQTGGVMPPTTLTAGGTVTIPPHTSFALIRNGGSIATGTVVLPNPVIAGTYQGAGSELEINFQNPVGTLTLTGSIEGPVPTGITTAHTSLAFVWGGSSWVRRIMA